MMSNSRLGPLWPSAAFAAAVAMLTAAAPAWAADPIFPPGSRVGLVPPPGMVASNTFDGFADPTRDAAILITVLPAAAYAQMDKTLDIETLKKQGVVLDKREPMQLAFGKGFLLIGRQTADKVRYKKWLLVAGASDLTALVTVQVPIPDDKTYPDNVVRSALATLTVRAKVPEAEELGLLPFAVGDFAGFQVEDVLRGRAVMLHDAPGAKDSVKGPRQFRPANIPGNRRHPRCHRDAVRAAADRRPIGLPDHGRGKGCTHRRRCTGDPVAALRWRRLPANGRHRQRR
jgi:hypothetical protein